MLFPPHGRLSTQTGPPDCRIAAVRRRRYGAILLRLRTCDHQL